MSKRDSVKRIFQRHGKRDETKTQFKMTCREVADLGDWVTDYCDNVEFNRLVSEAWNELERERKIKQRWG